MLKPLSFGKVIILVFLIGLPLLSINMQRNPGEAPWYTRPFTWTFSVLHYSYSSFSLSVRETTNLYLNLWSLKKTSSQLKDENSLLKAQLLSFKSLEAENKRLRELLEFREKSGLSMIAAQVIGHDIAGERNTITINRGSQHGITPGQAVISTQGVVGYILTPNLTTSHVLVATDRYAVIDANVMRSRARGLVEGTNKSFCQLRHLERADDVRVGDLVVTNGLGGVFPKGLPMGIVSQVKKSKYGVSQQVDIQPIVKARQLDEVFVVQKESL